MTSCPQLNQMSAIRMVFNAEAGMFSMACFQTSLNIVLNLFTMSMAGDVCRMPADSRTLFTFRYLVSCERRCSLKACLAIEFSVATSRQSPTNFERRY